MVAEGAQMRGVECRDEAVEESLVDRARGGRDSHLHRLAAVTDVGLTHDAHARRFDAVARQRIDRLRFEGGIEGGDRDEYRSPPRASLW